MLKIKKTFLVTGVAGFIGSKIAKRILINGDDVIGIDNLNNYYDKNLKIARLAEVEKCKSQHHGNFFFHKVSIENNYELEEISKTYSVQVVVHLAAQAGVRYSITNPKEYVDSNLVGFFNILEFCRKNSVENFLFASSSSVYGGKINFPFYESDRVDHPISFYAATKKSNELMAYSYSNLYQIPTTGLRFFTAYGPWGRPDMAPMLFASAIFKKESIKVFNKGNMKRDFTFIDDIAEGVFRCCQKPAIAEKVYDSNSNSVPYQIFNIGSGRPIDLLDFIKYLEDAIGIKAKKEYLSLQPGDVLKTCASVSKLKNWIDYSPTTSIENGIDSFVKWFKEYYKF